MKTRLWIFALLVVAALSAHLALLSPRVAHVAEEALNVRRAVATTGLRAQMDLIDARLSPRVLATTQELVDLLKAPTDVTQPMPKPDERALKAALTAAPGEPDLLIVANPQGAAVQRKGKGPTQLVPGAQVGSLPLARAILEGARPKPGFAQVEGALFRVSGAPTPTNTGAVVVGTLIDDQLASRLRTLLDAEVTFFDGGRIAATSVPAERRGQLQEWIKHPSPGYGLLEVRLPVVGPQLTGRLPLWADRQAWRAALVSMDSGVQAAVSVPAGSQLAWLGRYQGLYLAALIGLTLFALVWGLIPVAPLPAPAQPQAEPLPPPTPLPLEAHTDAAPGLEKPVTAAPDDVPWAATEEEPGGWDHLGEAREQADATGPAEPQGAHEEAGAPAALAEAGAAAAPAEASPDHVATQPKLQKPNIELIDLAPVAEAQAAQLRASETAREEAAQADQRAAAGESAPAADQAAAAEASPPLPAQEFSFAGLLDEAHEAAGDKAQPAAPPAAEKPAPIAFEEHRETTNPGTPSAELLAAMSDGESFRQFAARQDEAMEYFPGDEPTRIEPVSAALLDKLREMDDEAQGPRTVEHAPEKPGDRARAQQQAAEAHAQIMLPPADEPMAADDRPADELQPAAAAEPMAGVTAEPLAEAGAEPAAAAAHPGDETTDEFARHAFADSAARAAEAARADADQPEAHAAEEWPEQTAPQAIPSWPELHEEQPAEEPRAEEPPAEEPHHQEPAAHSEPAPEEAHAEPAAEAAQHDAPAASQNDVPTAPQRLPPPASQPEEPEQPEQPEQSAPAAAAANGATAEGQAVGDITLTNLQLPKPQPAPPSAIIADPDEPHWRETFQRFLETRAETGEPSEKLSYEKFAAKLRKNREDLLARHACRGVRFAVYKKEGKAAIKASAIK